jgi:hypothetical protein
VGIPPAKLTGQKAPAQHDAGLHVLDHQAAAPSDLDEVPSDGAVDGVHPRLLGVAVGVDQPAGQPQVIGGEDQGVVVGVGEDQPPAGAEDPCGLGDQGIRVGQALQHVVAEHPVGRGVGERQRVLEVGLGARVLPVPQPRSTTRSPGRAASSPASQRCRLGTTGSTIVSMSSGSPALGGT